MIAREFNHRLRVVQKNELSAEIGSTIYYGGMVDEVSAGVNPRVMWSGAGGFGAAKAGAEIFEHTRVQRIERGTTRRRVRLERQHFPRKKYGRARSL